MADKKENTKTLAQNKKARHEYFILETKIGRAHV